MAKTNAKVKKNTKQARTVSKKSKNENLYVIIAILVIVVVGLSVAYAALSTTLNITINKVTQNPLTWDVHFKSESVTGTMGGEQTSTTGLSCGTATSGGAAVTVSDTTLSKPGDRCYWKLTIQNAGGITAKLGSITVTDPSGITCTGKTTNQPTMACGDITYKITTDTTGSTLLAVNSTIAASGSQIVYLQAIYTSDTVSSTAVNQTGAKFTLVYNQA